MAENTNTSKNGINILVNNYINSLKWSEEQATSYEAQVNYYTSFIKGKHIENTWMNVKKKQFYPSKLSTIQ